MFCKSGARNTNHRKICEIGVFSSLKSKVLQPCLLSKRLILYFRWFSGLYFATFAPKIGLAKNSYLPQKKLWNWCRYLNSFLGASALPSVKKAASGLEPPPTILATGQNNNRKKLQLQFSFQEKSVSDDEENDDEIGSFAFVSQNHLKRKKNP